MNITQKELNLLKMIDSSEYGEAGSGDPVWLDYIVNTRALGGVLTSLQAKGLVAVSIVPMTMSDNAANGISDSTVYITALGLAALNENTSK